MCIRDRMVTVGTTRFDEMINEIDRPEVYEMFKKYGYTKIFIQYGRGNPPKNFSRVEGLNVEIYDLKTTFSKDLNESDLIISHCGGGTIMEAVKAKRNMIAVVNDTLMDNHQMEMYEKMTAEHYIYGVKSPKELKTELELLVRKVQEVGVKPYPEPKKDLISQIIQELF
eukprot:TRINITY_DN2674_c0_g1_i2.p1 TRINITY_DN2674_c0_g1~~TRINITY_DN2674_c0_g1_i2.p1  ORF type:complete len:189 (-),score=60.49 TRINITY_DN2674_c0_g1_i2:106-612(-)